MTEEGRPLRPEEWFVVIVAVIGTAALFLIPNAVDSFTAIIAVPLAALYFGYIIYNAVAPNMLTVIKLVGGGVLMFTVTSFLFS